MRRIIHLRSKNFKGGMTIVADYDSTTNTTTIYHSICSIKDSFNKKQGVETALQSKAATINDDVTTERLVSTTFRHLPNATKVLAIKSIMFSMYGIKLTKTHINLIKYKPVDHTLVSEFLVTSNNKGNKVTFNEIRTLHTVVQQIKQLN